MYAGNNGNWFYQLVFNRIIRLWYYWLILFLLPIVAWDGYRKITLSDDNLRKPVLIDFLSWCIFFIYSAEGCSGQNLSIWNAWCDQPNAHKNSDQEHGQHGSCKQTQLCKCQTSCPSKGMIHIKMKFLTFSHPHFILTLYAFVSSIFRLSIQWIIWFQMLHS